MENGFEGSSGQEFVEVCREPLARELASIMEIDDLGVLRAKIEIIKACLNANDGDALGLLDASPETDTIPLRADILVEELDQILGSQTLQRAKYYVERLKKGVKQTKTSAVNDINLKRWKEYDDILTDSLWIEPKRDRSGAHQGWYWGNFIPQIPRQMMQRYTKKGDWVLDAFSGSGTTLIECRKLGRNGLGIELCSDIAEKARELVNSEENPQGTATSIFVGDSRKADIKALLGEQGVENVQLIILHPPYHDIIEFPGEDEGDLSKAQDVQEFLDMFGDVVGNTSKFLENGRYLVLVIGDKYLNSEWVPLGFKCMQEVLDRGFLLKSIVVKNFEQTRGKRSQAELWRYRALVGGCYIFKHEYIFIFKKE